MRCWALCLAVMVADKVGKIIVLSVSISFHLSHCPVPQTTKQQQPTEYMNNPAHLFKHVLVPQAHKKALQLNNIFPFFLVGGGWPCQIHKCLGWKLHERACKQYIFWSYNICFQCFAYSRLSFHMPVQKRKQKGRLRVWNFTLLLVVFKRHNGSEKVKPDNNGDKGHISCCTSTSANHSQVCAACRCSYCE